jgi:D-arabinose 1-dehydrogenase-like Zn-dependent alcohol dehydrogenase
MQNRAAALYGMRPSHRRGPIPEPGPMQVLVEVDAVGVCGSDGHGRVALEPGRRAAPACRQDARSVEAVVVPAGATE